MERFIRFDEEEKKRKVMGLSTFRRAAELKVLVEAAASQRLATSECDAALASRILGEKQALEASWNEDTCRRYLLISERINAEASRVMTKWERPFWTHLSVGPLAHDVECRRGSNDGAGLLPRQAY